MFGNLLTLVLMLTWVFLQGYVNEKRKIFFLCRIMQVLVANFGRIAVVQTKLRWTISSHQRAISLGLSFFICKIRHL